MPLCGVDAGCDLGVGIVLGEAAIAHHQIGQRVESGLGRRMVGVEFSEPGGDLVGADAGCAVLVEEGVAGDGALPMW